MHELAALNAAPPTGSEAASVVLPPFCGLKLEQISIIRNQQQADAALPLLLAADALGFDTESQPTFVKGQVSTGPHLIQFATDQHAYLIPLVTGATDEAMLEFVRTILHAPVLKVGFGLRNDTRALQRKLDAVPSPVLDLARALREKKKGEVGAKTAVERFFGQRMNKPKAVSTSNWGKPHLNNQQILYAANDAYVALQVYRKWLALGKPR